MAGLGVSASTCRVRRACSMRGGFPCSFLSVIWRAVAVVVTCSVGRGTRSLRHRRMQTGRPAAATHYPRALPIPIRHSW